MDYTTKQLLKISRFFLVIILVSGWVFYGWPQIWDNPPFPPKIEKTQAAASYVGGQVGSFAGKTSATTVTFALTNGSASTPAADDLVIVAYSVGSTADRALTIRNGSVVDYTLAGSELYQNDTYDSNLRVAYRFMPATPETTVVLSGTGSTADAGAYTIHVFRGIDPSTPLDVAAVTAGGINTRLANPGSILPTTSGAWIYVVGGAAAATGGTFTAAYLTDLRATTRSDTNDSNIASGYVTWSSGTYDPAAFGGGGTNTTNDSWTAVTLALRPAPTIIAPTVTTQSASSVETTTATGNGNITATGGQDATAWGVCYKTSSPCTTADSVAAGSGSGGTGAFTASMTSLSSGTTYYIKAYATNSAGTSYGSEVQILTKPAAPTGVAATDGTYTNKVTITWTKSTGATDYHVWRDAVDLGSAGDVATFDDIEATAPTITAGSAVSSDGTSTAQADLSLSGASANNGVAHTYKVVASNTTGNSVDSATDAGYRGVGSLTYQWQRSAADSDASYSDISGATSSAYGDTAAPAPTITAGTASTTDGSATDKVTLSISGASANVGAGRYYKVVLNATGAAQQTSAVDRGYRSVGSLTYQWNRSSGDADSGYSALSGATTSPYDDTTAPAPTITAGTAAASDGTSILHVVLSVSGQSANSGAGRYFYATISATGATSQDTTHDRGYIGVGSLTYQWQRSAADSDASYSDISGATTASHNDTGAPDDGSGRYFRVVENAAGAAQQISAVDRGYRTAVVVSISASDGSVSYGIIVVGASKTTIDLTDTQTLTNNGNVTETFNIMGQNTSCPWTLAAASGTDQYVHQFCKKSDVSCSSPPTNYTALTTSYQTLYSGVASTATKQIDLRVTVPSTSSCFTSQAIDVTIQATQ